MQAARPASALASASVILSGLLLAVTALALPGGPLLLLVAGAALSGAGLWQLVKAAKADFLRHLNGRVAGQAWVMWLGRAGYAARGFVFVIIGWSLLQAGLSDSAAQAGGMEQALGSLSGTLLAGAALGLLFGLFSFVEAQYRRINDPNVAARSKGAVRALGRAEANVSRVFALDLLPTFIL